MLSTRPKIHACADLMIYCGKYTYIYMKISYCLFKNSWNITHVYWKKFLAKILEHYLVHIQRKKHQQNAHGFATLFLCLVQHYFMSFLLKNMKINSWFPWKNCEHSLMVLSWEKIWTAFVFACKGYTLYFKIYLK